MGDGAWVATLAVVAGFGGMVYISQQELKVQEAKAKKVITAAMADSNKRIYCTVEKKVYDNVLTKVPEYHKEVEKGGLVSASHAMAHSNETVKIDSKLSLRLRTNDRDLLGVTVLDSGLVTKESLDRIVDVGSRVSIPKGNLKYGYFHAGKVAYKSWNETYFRKGVQAGSKLAHRIRVHHKR